MPGTVLITGASSGIGEDAALHFNELGYLVFAGVRRLDDGERVQSAATHPDSLQPVLLDVTSPAQVNAARDTVLDRVGPSGLTTLVSNAGIAVTAPPASCEQCPLETQQKLMDVNFFGAVRVVQTFLPMLRASGGTVIFNTALMAHTVIPFNGGYAASKCALEGWADSLRREVQPLGVSVAIIEGAFVATDLVGGRPAEPAPPDDVYPLEGRLYAAARASTPALARRASAAPRRVSEAMGSAAESSSRARTRRIVGAGARAIWAVGCLPNPLQDAIFRVVLPRLPAQSRHRDASRQPVPS